MSAERAYAIYMMLILTMINGDNGDNCKDVSLQVDDECDCDVWVK